MDAFYVFIIENDVWIYIICGLGLFWYLGDYWRSRRLLQQAVFGLERERGTNIRNTAVTLITIFAAVSGGVYYINAAVAPTLPPELLTPPTHTPDIFATPLSSPTPLGTPELGPPVPTPPLVPTVTLPGDASALTDPANSDIGANEDIPAPNITSEPSLVVTPVVQCTRNLSFSEPSDGAVISGAISFFGTADTDNFQFYKLEANGPETNGEWASLIGRTIEQPVTDSFLGNANLGEWRSGPYLIRLTVVDDTFNETGQCVIQITLNNG